MIKNEFEIINGTRQRSGPVQQIWQMYAVAMPGYGAWTGQNEGGFVKDACAVSVDGMWILEDSDPREWHWDYKARKR